MAKPDSKMPHEVFCYYNGDRIDAVRSSDYRLVFPRKVDIVKPPQIPYRLPA